MSIESDADKVYMVPLRVYSFLMQTTILRGIVGSIAYGLATEQSDTDRLGVFVAPTTQVAGLSWHSKHESVGHSGPEGDDHMEHEVGKYLRLALKANPTVVELLGLPFHLYEVMTEEGYMLMSNASAFLSHKAVHTSYFEYATAQREKLMKKDKPKYAKHTLRLLEQAEILLSTGRIQVEVQNPQRYHDLNDMSPEQRWDVVNEAIRNFPALHEKSVLPEHPDKERAQSILNAIRLNHL